MSEVAKVYNQYKSLKLDQVQNYDRYNELLLIHSSSAMEGSTLTLDETELLIEEGTTPKGKPLEHSLMVKDHYKALRHIIDQARSLQKISDQTIKTIASLVMSSTGGAYSSALGTVDSRHGDYRLSASRAAGGSYYVGHDKIEPMMKDFITNINEALPKLSSINDAMTLSAYAHLQLLTIHPFVDGNGRTARLLQNLILLKNNFPLLIIRHEQKAGYIASIKEARAKEDVLPFQKFLETEYVYHLKLEISKAQAMKDGKSKGISFTINL